MPKLPTRPELISLAAGDLIHVVDISDTIDDPTGSSRKITAANQKNFFSPVASETVSGIQEVASQVEHDAGVADNKSVTPLKLANGVWGAYNVVEVQTASNVATIEFINLASLPYRNLCIKWDGVTPVVDAASIYVRVSNNNGSTWNSGAADYAYALDGRSSAPLGANDGSGASTAVILNDNAAGRLISNAVYAGHDCEATFFNLSSTTKEKHMIAVGDYSGDDDINNITFNLSGNFYGNLDAVNGIQILFDNGNISEGTFKLYGIK